MVWGKRSHIIQLTPLLFTPFQNFSKLYVFSNPMVSDNATIIYFSSQFTLPLPGQPFHFLLLPHIFDPSFLSLLLTDGSQMKASGMIITFYKNLHISPSPHLSNTSPSFSFFLSPFLSLHVSAGSHHSHLIKDFAAIIIPP